MKKLHLEFYVIANLKKNDGTIMFDLGSLVNGISTFVSYSIWKPSL